MASRIVFMPTLDSSKDLFKEQLVSFEWVPGMAISQGTKSVKNLHLAAQNQLGIQDILEISTRSDSPFGISLSAFNQTLTENMRSLTVEVAYQASKVFENGGPYTDLLLGSSLQAKQDPRLKSSGFLIGFRFDGTDWPLVSTPNFYDYIYAKALLERDDFSELLRYQGFTDIAYNQNSKNLNKKKSFNCQARTAALVVALQTRMEHKKILPYLKSESQREAIGAEQLGLF